MSKSRFISVLMGLRVDFFPRTVMPADKLRQSAHRFLGQQKGLTLVEMVATVALLITLLVMTAGALSYYFAIRSLDVAVREETTQIREAQALALATGNTYRIDFSNAGGTTYQLQRRQGDQWVNVRGALNLPGGVKIAAAPPPSFGGDLYLEFYARGTSEDGQVVLEGRFGRSRTIQVEGETVNVNTT